MTDILAFLYLPILAGVVTAGIHAYLGVHIVERRAVLAGLLLPQMAVLGTTIALFRGAHLHSRETWVWSLAFALAGAAIVTLTAGIRRDAALSREAIIGIVFVVSAAVTILVMSRGTGESEHLEDMLFGNILAVSRRLIFDTAVVYAAVAIVHYVLRGGLRAADPGTTAMQRNARWWDFAFYASCAVVVTSSVAIAGILLVFSYLLVPAVASMLFSKSIGMRLAIGWTMGAVVSAAGVLLSFPFDLPTGATIVCTFGMALGLMALFRVVRGKRVGE